MPEQKRHAKQDGPEKQISARIYHRPTHSRNGLSIDRFGGSVFERQRPTADSHRRSSAIPTGDIADIWGHKALPSQKRQRQTQVSPSQAAFGFASGCGKETSRRQRPFVESIEQSIVWQKEGNRKAYSKAGARSIPLIQPLMFINVIKLYQYHEVVPKTKSQEFRLLAGGSSTRRLRF